MDFHDACLASVILSLGSKLPKLNKDQMNILQHCYSFKSVEKTGSFYTQLVFNSEEKLESEII